jgi:hypothetical protein
MAEMSAETMAALKEVVVYNSGMIYCSACAPADMPVAEVEAEVNRQSPTGISSAWRIADEPFEGGAPNPSDCNDGPLKKHYLLSC